MPNPNCLSDSTQPKGTQMFSFVIRLTSCGLAISHFPFREIVCFELWWLFDLFYFFLDLWWANNLVYCGVSP